MSRDFNMGSRVYTSIRSYESGKYRFIIITVYLLSIGGGITNYNTSTLISKVMNSTRVLPFWSYKSCLALKTIDIVFILLYIPILNTGCMAELMVELADLAYRTDLSYRTDRAYRNDLSYRTDLTEMPYLHLSNQM